MTNISSHDYLGEIAIIGMAGRFPGARNVDEFWHNLREGIESIHFYSDEELLACGVDPEVLKDPHYVRAAAILPDVEYFDASFFGFTPKEAEITDPQHRLFLECAWEALESAAYVPGACKERIGVYAGAGTSNYILHIYTNPNLAASAGAFQIEIGNDKDYLATRVSYKLNLTGPSLTVQTGCSTSLVAVHLASQALLDYECDMALAGGVSVSSYKPSGYLYQEGGVRSPDGHCRTFDAQAKGTLAGSGVGIVVLKRMADAIADRDHIHAVIKASAVNNDGAAKIGYTAPSIEGQAEVIAKALALAGVNADKIAYVEAHGTGTTLGDPIEIAALTKCFRADTDKKGFCAVGSVKTNVGHLNAAAGVTGLIKTTLSLEHQMIPPSLHFVHPNPDIDFVESPFYVNTQLNPWRTNGEPRLAGVSSFSIGGTNAHVIVAEAPAIASCDIHRDWHLLTLSARTDTALDALTAQLATHLKQNPETNPADLAYTLNAGRKKFAYRRMLVYRDIEHAIEALEALEKKRDVPAIEDEETPRSVVFMFPGQGAQHVDMARELYQTESAFRVEVDRCAELLVPALGLDLRDVMYANDSKTEEQLRQTCFAQPALFVTEYALAKLWMAWGVRPSAMIGHSVGEYVAACLSGVLSLEDALSLLVARGKLMQQLPEGAMLAVLLSEAAVMPLLGEKLSLAAVNGPSSCVVSGRTEDVIELERLLSKQNVPSRRLDVLRAFHSQVVEQIAGEFARELSHIQLRPPQIPYLSNVTGTWIQPEEATDPSYWIRQLRQTVRFSDGISHVLKNPKHLLLEVGPGETLCGIARQHNSGQLILPSLRKPRQPVADVPSMLETLGHLWLAGAFDNWQEFYSGEPRQRLPLPTYPFERERFWVENKSGRNGMVQQHSLQRKADFADWLYAPLWRQSFPVNELEAESEEELCWLIFLDEYGIGIHLVDQLKQTSAVIVTVEAGQFRRHEEDRYSIDIEQAKDYVRLLDELAAAGKMPSRIVHLSSVARPDGSVSAIESYETALRRGYQSLLFLAQALGDQQTTKSVSIFAISNNMHNVVGNDALRPEAATVLGACKVIPKDYPHLTCRSIDIVLPERESLANMVAQLTAEVKTESADTVIALRGEHRWVQTFEPLKSVNGTTTFQRIRPGGTYLLTDVWSEISFAVAERLAKDFSARLVVVDQAAFPPRHEWTNWLDAHSEEESLSQKLRTLLSLEASGAEIHVFTGDLTNVAEMREIVASPSQRLGTINGVFHMPPSLPAGLIQLRANTAFNHDFHVKAKGVLVLEEVLKDQPLDFVVLFSSLTSIIPGFGQVEECATSAVLNTVAQARYRERHAPVVSINWPTWRSAKPPQVKVGGATLAQLEEREKYGLTPQEGVDVLSRILSMAAPQVLISTRDFQALIERLHSLTTKDALEELERARSLDSSPARRALKSNYAAPRGAVEKMLADIWQDLFGIEQIGVHDDFLELGGHSLLAIQLITRVREAFQIELPLTSLFSSPTIAGLAESIITQQLTPAEIEEIEQLYQEIENLSATDVQERLAGELHRLEEQRQHGSVF